MKTRTAMAIKILAAGIAIIVLINYGFKTDREHKEAKNTIKSLKNQLKHIRTKLKQADTLNETLLNRVDELKKLLASRSKIEKQLRKSIPAKNEPETAAPKKTVRGLVTAILYTLQGSSVVIDDVILHEGNQIHGVKIVKIKQDTVEFAKASHRWTQKINQSPPNIWTQKEK